MRMKIKVIVAVVMMSFVTNVLVASIAQADSVQSAQPVLKVSLVTKSYNNANVSYVAFCVNALERVEDWYFYYFSENTYEEKRAKEIFALLLAARSQREPVTVFYNVNAEGKRIVSAIHF